MMLLAEFHPGSASEGVSGRRHDRRLSCSCHREIIKR
jgi:hypothetical protein